MIKVEYALNFGSFRIDQIMSLLVFILVGIVASIISGTFASNTTNTLLPPAFAVGETQQNQQPNIKASNIYQTHNMVLGKDVKNLIIEIPNEGHEDPRTKGIESCQSTLPSSKCNCKCWYYSNMV